MSEAVSHPKHYTSGPPCKHCGHVIECIDIAKHASFSIGNVWEYLWRAGKKGPAIEDLMKARQYLDFEIERLQEQSNADA